MLNRESFLKVVWRRCSSYAVFHCKHEFYVQECSSTVETMYVPQNVLKWCTEEVRRTCEMQSGKLLPWQANRILQDYLKMEMGPALLFLFFVQERRSGKKKIFFSIWFFVEVNDIVHWMPNSTCFTWRLWWFLGCSENVYKI